MKRLLAFVLACAVLLCGCAQTSAGIATSAPTETKTEETTKESEITVETSQEETESDQIEEDTPEFRQLNDPQLLQYIEDSLYADVTEQFSNEDYVIENVSAVYYSKEYLEELAYNSKTNIFFGYDLESLNEQFQGTPYVFTLGDNGETTVVPFEDYDDAFDRVIRNVAIGTGVILICVTVSVATGGAGLAPVSMIFAASAKTGTAMALSSGAMGAVVAGTVKGIQTGDMEEATKAAALAGSESFKWGAISGALIGGVSEASALRNASKTAEVVKNATTSSGGVPTWRESELSALETYGGREQISYIAGEEVPFGTPGGTRPDVVRMVGDHLEAIEVKNYNLESSASRSELYSELVREVSARVENLPPNSTQRIVLDVTGREFSEELVTNVTETITERLIDIYADIPIDIVGL